MNSKIPIIIIILFIVIFGISYYLFPEIYSNLSMETNNIEIVQQDIVPEERQIEVKNAEMDIRYDANLVLNELSRNEFSLTLYLSSKTDNEPPDITSDDIYAYISANGNSFFGSSEILKHSEKDKIAISMVMDYSGSMENNIIEMQNAANSFIDNFAQNDIAEIIKFGSQVDRISNFISNKTSLKELVYKDSYTRSGTSLFAAINAGLDDFSAINQYYTKAVVVFSDGQDNNSENYNVTYNDVIMKSQSNKIPLFTIGLQDMNSDDFNNNRFQETLNGLSSNTGGFNYMTTDPAKLADLYNRINTSLRNNYIIKIKWESEQLPAPGTSANLFVRVMEGDKAIANINKQINIP